MLFRLNDGNIIHINRFDFNNDNLYYSKIMTVKSQRETERKKETKQKNISSIFFSNDTSKHCNNSTQIIAQMIKDFY